MTYDFKPLAVVVPAEKPNNKSVLQAKFGVEQLTGATNKKSPDRAVRAGELLDTGLFVFNEAGVLVPREEAKSIIVPGKNRLINGDMRVWQRGTSFGAAVSYYSADRWVTSCGGSTVASYQLPFSGSQRDVPGNPRYMLRQVVYSAPGASNYATVRQRIEGVDTLAGKRCTLSFWAKADAPRNISVEFAQRVGSAEDRTAIGVKKLALSTLWTFCKASFDMPVFTASTFGSNYLELLLWMDAGASFNTRTDTLGQQSGTFDFAMAQFEAGNEATTFDWLPDAQQLTLCQRFYEKSYTDGVFPGAANQPGYESATLAAGAYFLTASPKFKVAKRALPAVTARRYTDGSVGLLDNYGTTGALQGSLPASVVNISTNGFEVRSNGTGTAGNAMRYQWEADAEL